MSFTTVFTNAYATIFAEKEKNYLELRWLKHPTSEDFRDTYLVFLKYTLDHQITHWICDMRQLYYLEVSDQNWVVQDVFTALDLKFNYKFAYVVSPQGMELMTSYRIIDMVKNTPELAQKLDIEIFLEETTAREWLLAKK